MVNGVFSTIGFSDSERKLAERVGNRGDGALAVRLRYKMVEGRHTHAKGDIDLSIAVPHTLSDEGTISRWAQNFFKEAFPGKEDGIRVDALPTRNGELIGVHLSGAAASRYRQIMQNLDLAEQSIEKDPPVAARG